MTEIVLRPDQQICVDEIEAVFRRQARLKLAQKSVLLNLATGGGKTYIGASIIKRSQAKKKRCFFICNRIELIDQTVKSFNNLGVKTGIIADGYPEDYSLLTQVCSIDTLKNRLHKIHYMPDLVVHDECRGVAAAGWSRVYHYYGDSYHLGLDATPERGDGKPLRPYFQEMVKGLPIKELIKIGALVAPRCFAPEPPDMSKVRINKNGEWNEEDAAAAVNKPSITGSAIDHYRMHGESGQGLIFAVNIKNSEEVAASFRAAGISCVHLDANTPKHERKAIIEAYRRREIDLLSNCNLFSAGFDVPNVSVIVDLCPTKSISQYKQRAGRGARPLDGKNHYIYLDHVGNIDTHNMLPHDEKEWSLDGRKKKKKSEEQAEPKVTLRKCPECYCSHEPEPICPSCGYIYPPQLREIEIREGELQEITSVERKPLKRWQLAEQLAAAKTVDALVKIQKENGYKKGWVYHMQKIKGL